MARYFKMRLLPAYPSKPPLAPLTGLQPMRRSRATSVMKAQDEIPGLGRRVMTVSGLKGAKEWLVPNSFSSSVPKININRVVWKAEAVLSPGCFYALSLITIPHGIVAIDDELSSTQPQGKIKVDITWTDADGNTDSTSTEVDTPPSMLDDSSEPTGSGEIWGAMRHVIIPGIRPPETLSTNAKLRQWTRPPVTATCSVSYIGSPRVVDCCLYEVPFWVAHESDDDPETEWIAHIYDDRASIVTIPTTAKYPWEEVSSTTPDGNPRLGTQHLLDIHHAQRRRLGPILLSWSSYHEQETTSDDTVPPPQTTSSTTFESLTHGSDLTSYSADSPGWLMGTGGYARDHKHNDEDLRLRGRNAVIPVRVRAYAGRTTDTSSESATIRVQTADYSYLDLGVSQNLMAWHEIQGYLRCGITPDERVPLHVFFKVGDGADVLSVRYLEIEYDAQPDSS